MATGQGDGIVVTDVPARLDNLPWGRFHWLVVTALGVTWILDGLEVTVVGALSGALGSGHGLSLTPSQIGLTGSAYIAGAVIGALVFGRLTDTLGRKRLFTVTVAVYLTATLATGLSWDFFSFAVFRAITGAGIGGEYAAVNSAVQELIPARRRGQTDLIINGSFWIGAALGAIGSVIVLDPRILPPAIGWRFAFVGGAVLGLVVIYVRRFLPESPRWLMTHGRVAEAEAIVGAIESRAGLAAPTGLPRIGLRARAGTGLIDVARTLIATYPRRTVLGVTLMATQAFCYNAIFFTYATILTTFYQVPPNSVGWFLLPFAAGNVLGPLLLGWMFDRIGRRPMITATYAIAGVLLIVVGWLFARGALDVTELTLSWSVIFFFASAAASAAYLTVGESFPLETRAMVIALFYAFGTGLGGIAGPALFGALIEGGTRAGIFPGYLLGGALMLLAAGAELWLGVRAERLSLEEVAPPLSSAPIP
ncbi:MFS transporter [Caulobacter sp. KR2-114]|uniref:MFS transporter n=1 Tax=Caulobacter sp. KR2-114 TaxID=3400912 RepID=UPI003C0CC1DE